MSKRVLASILAAVMILTVFAIVPVSASTNGHSQSEAVAWANSQIGKALDYDGYFGAQCVDLIYYYYVYLGHSSPGGNANQFGNGGNYTPSGWSYQSTPQPGDIAVDYSYSPGHVGIVTRIEGNYMYCVEQNYNNQQWCQEVRRSLYSHGYSTFIRPDFSSTVSVSFPQYTGEYTYIKETDASVGITLQVSNGKPSQVGMVLYDSTGTNQIAKKADNDDWVGIWYYKINEELGVKLTAATTYKYQFFAVVNGKKYTSEMRSFTTLGHSWGSWSVTKAATCTETGTKSRTCSTCQLKQTETIKAIGHSWGSWGVTKAATCTENGVKTRVCANNSAHKETQSIPATGHSWSAWTVAKAATATEEGYEIRICAKDPSHTETRIIPPTGGGTGFKLGDVNGDGKLNAKDVTALMKAIVKGGAAGNSAADFDGNGRVNAKDVTALMKYLVSLG